MCVNSSTLEQPASSAETIRVNEDSASSPSAAPVCLPPSSLSCSCAHTSTEAAMSENVKMSSGSLNGSTSARIVSSSSESLSMETLSSHTGYSSTGNVGSTPQLKSILVKLGSDTKICGTYPRTQANKRRCWECRSKIGLTSVTCRCGFTFCNEHRYAEEHSCLYDFKSAAKRKLRDENFVVVPAKVARIN